MRIYKLRFDMLICFLLAALMVFGTEKILPVFYSALYDKYLEAHTVADEMCIRDSRMPFIHGGRHLQAQLIQPVLPDVYKRQHSDSLWRNQATAGPPHIPPEGRYSTE